jgi:putative N-acetylmannosamine-6-phosphate epimerase
VSEPRAFAAASKPITLQLDEAAAAALAAVIRAAAPEDYGAEPKAAASLPSIGLIKRRSVGR